MGWMDGWMGYIPDSTNYKSTASGAKNESKLFDLIEGGKLSASTQRGKIKSK